MAPMRICFRREEGPLSRRERTPPRVNKKTRLTRGVSSQGPHAALLLDEEGTYAKLVSKQVRTQLRTHFRYTEHLHLFNEDSRLPHGGVQGFRCLKTLRVT